MGKGTKVVAHASMDKFYKCGYGEGHTISIGYPLPSLCSTARRSSQTSTLHHNKPKSNVDAEIIGGST